ncbi:MAG: trimethylamine methyltransferase family protein [Caldilineaceae bacterium]
MCAPINGTALSLLRQAGAQVNGDLVKLSPSLVEWALAGELVGVQSLPRTDQPVVKLDGEGVYFGPGSDTLHFLDLTGAQWDYQQAGHGRLHPRLRCPARDRSPCRWAFRATCPPRPTSATSLRSWCATPPSPSSSSAPIGPTWRSSTPWPSPPPEARTHCGAIPHCSSIRADTPLQHSVEATEKLLFCAEHSIPAVHSPAPMMGGTAPVTVTGAAVLGNAEMLSGLVIHQLQRTGAPFLYGHGVHHLDMQTMVSVYGAPEFQHARLLAAAMGRFYRLPVWGYAGHTDSKVVDGQAAADAQFSVLVALLAGTNLNHDVGYIESGLGASPELMVLTDEIIAQTRHFARGVRLDDDALAVDVINQVGPGGEFMSHPHTLTNWRSLWVPGLFDRQRLDPWREAGAKDVAARVREKTIALMDEHTVPALTPAVEAEIARLLAP